MLVGLLKLSGMLILKIVYGKQYEEKANSSKGIMTAIMIFLSLLNTMWLLCLLFLLSGGANKDTMLCIIVSIVYPVCIAIWSIVAHQKYKPSKKMNEKNNKNTSEISNTQSTVINKNDVDAIIDSSNSNLNSSENLKKLRETSPIFCRKCGSKLPNDSLFCNKCGTEIKWGE